MFLFTFLFLLLSLLSIRANTHLRGTQHRQLALELLHHHNHFITSQHPYEYMQIVVARYQEDMSALGWIREHNHFVYNRGTHFVDFNSTQMKENVGREGYIYLKHIVQNYYNLPNVTIFLQADASSNPHNVHSPTLKDNIQKLANAQLSFPETSEGFMFLGARDNCKNFLEPCNRNYPWLDYGFKLLNFTSTNTHYAPQGLFAVTKEAIYRNQRVYYETLLDLVSHENSPDFGWFLECAWSSVFHSKCGERTKNYNCFPENRHCDWDRWGDK